VLDRLERGTLFWTDGGVGVLHSAHCDIAQYQHNLGMSFQNKNHKLDYFDLDADSLLVGMYWNLSFSRPQ
jgi:hypothetical protein